MTINVKAIAPVLVLIPVISLFLPGRPPEFKIRSHPPADISSLSQVGESLGSLLTGYFSMIHSHSDYIIHCGKAYHKRYSSVNSNISLSWPVASMSKQFTGYLSATLVVDRKIAWEATTGEYIPLLCNTPADCSIGSLSRHTSGIDAPELYDYWKITSTDDKDRQDVILAYPERFHGTGDCRRLYSDYNYTLLRMVIDSVRDYDQLFHQQIIGVLDMKETSLEIRSRTWPVFLKGSFCFSPIARPDWIIRIPMPVWNISPLKGAVGVSSSVNDLFKWYQYLRRLYISGDKLSSEYFPEKDGSYRNGLVRTSYKYSTAVFHHGGLIPGFASFMLMDFERDIFIVYLCDASVWKSNYDIDEEIISLVKGREYRYIPCK